MSTFISAKSLFTGSEWINETAVEINDGKIVSISKEHYDASAAFPYIVPAFIDLQI
jgi:N-acetylglucosamine-6-phosphate deacetylase